MKPLCWSLRKMSHFKPSTNALFKKLHLIISQILLRPRTNQAKAFLPSCLWVCICDDYLRLESIHNDINSWWSKWINTPNHFEVAPTIVNQRFKFWNTHFSISRILNYKHIVFRKYSIWRTGCNWLVAIFIISWSYGFSYPNTNTFVFH